MIAQFIQDASFAAIAAIGFAAVSRPPCSAYIYCGVIAAAGHSLRFALLELSGGRIHIVAATALAALLIGLLAVLAAPRARIPAETYLYPSLLPMIPGIYAYKAFGGLVMCLTPESEEQFNHCFYLFASNGLTCFCLLLAMVVGASAPLFLLKRIAFTATRNRTPHD